jgi:hypothetical protein
MENIMIGVFLFFSSLWGGSYIFGTLPYGHWAIVPTLVTAMIFGVLGVVLFCLGIDQEAYKEIRNSREI